MFSLKKDQLDGELPQGFINVVAKKGKYIFSSMDLVRMHFIILIHARALTY